MTEATGSLSGRLKLVFNKASNREVAGRLGISEGTVRNYLRGSSQPTPELLEQISDLFGVSLYWLMTGEGERTQTDKDEPAPGLIRVPLYDIRASAGVGALTDDNPELLRHFDLPEWWLRNVVHVSPKAVEVLVAWGDSMKPDVMPGDLLIIDTSHHTVQADCLYVFEMDGGVFIKKLQRLPGGKLKVISANPDYEAYNITPANDPTFKVVGRVAFHGKVI